MKQYQDLMRHILDKGIRKEDRTGTGTISVFGYQMRFNLQEGFPLVTTKRVFWKGVVEELAWMLRGETNVRSLQEKGVTIWDEWADAEGELGPVYGKQWRSWEGFTPAQVSAENPGIIGNLDRLGTPICERKTIDQIADVIEQIKKNPDSRRLIVTAWNPAEVEQMKLPPCHMMFQFYTRPATLAERYTEFGRRQGGCDFPMEGDEEYVEKLCNEESIPTRMIDLQLYQRSADVFLGVPFNIASYALLLTLIAHEVGMMPGEFVWTGGDTHLYLNHLEQVQLQLSREPKQLPEITISTELKSIFDLKFEDVFLDHYQPHGAIKAEVAV